MHAHAHNQRPKDVRLFLALRVFGAYCTKTRIDFANDKDPERKTANKTRSNWLKDLNSLIKDACLDNTTAGQTKPWKTSAHTKEYNALKEVCTEFAKQLISRESEMKPSDIIE